ncbi:MAG: hypothetical protein DPW16_18590 [Chloroflexi bacterium]|nr:hypothetical protein [Chloroflexota bacterium]
MGVIFQVSDYYKLLALYKALMLVKFSKNPADPVLVGSPFIAEMLREIVASLAQMEIQRGHPQQAELWKALKLDPAKETWQSMLEYARISDLWQQWTFDEKLEYAKILLSPFEVTDALLAKFVVEVDDV